VGRAQASIPVARGRHVGSENSQRQFGVQKEPEDGEKHGEGTLGFFSVLRRKEMTREKFRKRAETNTMGVTKKRKLRSRGKEGVPVSSAYLPGA